jgi:HK97 gp10 family phage protein
MNAVFSMNGLPTLNARLDKIAMAVANPITRDALEAGGKVIQKRAEAEVHRLTGMLAGDIVVVTRIKQASAPVGQGHFNAGEKYVLIGPGWNPDLTRHSGLSGTPYASKTGPIGNRQASNRQVAAADQTTNPGVYGFFLEVGHRAPGQGLSKNLQFKRDQRAARKLGQRVNTKDYGHLSTPPYPWLKPAFDASKDEAVAKMAEVIESRLDGLGL